MRPVRQADRRGGARYLLHRDDVGEVAHAGSAVILRDGQPEKSEAAELRPEIARKDVAAVDLAGARRDALIGEAAHLVAHRIDGFSQTEIEFAVGGTWHESDPIVIEHQIVG